MRMMFRRRMMAICFGAMASAVLLGAESKDPRVGKWNMTSETQGDAVNWILALKEVDGKLTGALATGDSETAVKDFSYTDDAIRFKAPYEGEDYQVDLKLSGNKLEGTWSGNGSSGRTSGTKAP